MIFDTHCHLGWDGEDAALAHARAVQAGVTRILLVGIDLPSSLSAKELATRLAGTAWSAGLHPNSAKEHAASWTELAHLARDPSCVAIGETGLDFYRDHATQAEQKTALRDHLELARAIGKPVVLHCRAAFAALFAELEDFAPCAGIMHCFSGGVAEARQALELGLHLSFAGPLTYPKSDALREAASFAPPERLLVETDAPFLPPQPWRGKRNEPAYVTATLAKLAEIRGESFEAMAATTTANARKLLRVP